MTETTLDKDSCTRGLTTRLIGSVINFHDEVTSTNDVAREMAKGDAREGTVVMARSQTGGMGRLGRPFSSPVGGLYLSVILRPNMALGEISPLPLVVGLSVSKAIQCNTFKEASLKWPNDVQIEGKKVAGILVTSSAKGEKADHVIVGIGINLNTKIKDLPEDLQNIAGSLKEVTGNHIDPNEFTRDLLYFLDLHYSMFMEGQGESLMDQWVSRSSTIGTDVEVTTSNGYVRGKAIGIDQTGALVLQTKSGMARVDSGDCTSLTSS